MATRKRNEKNHDAKKNPGSAEFFAKQRKERNALRAKQLVTEFVSPEGKTVVIRERV